ncbi:MAG: ABC transporter substrate-binding protein [Nitriliruptoraceae bacterium]
MRTTNKPLLRRPRVAGAFLAVAALLLAACASEDDGADTESVAAASSDATDDETAAESDTAADTEEVAANGEVDVIRLTYVSPDFLGVPIEEALDDLRGQVDFEIETRQVNGWYGDLAQAVQREIAADDVSDIAMMGLSNLRQFVEADRVTPLTDLFDAEGQDFAAMYDPAFLDLMSFDGELYGMGYAYSNAVMYYNRDLFEQAGLDPDAPPETWEDVLAVSRTMREALGEDVVPITYPTDGDNWMFQTNLASAGGSFMNEAETEFTFNSPEAVAAVEFWKGLVDEGLMPIEGYDDMRERFFQGNQGMILDTVGALGRVDEGVGDRFAWDTGLLPIPADGERALAVGGSGFSIMTDDPDRVAAAWEVLKYLASPEVQYEQSTQLGYLSTNLLVTETSADDEPWGRLEELEEDPRLQPGYQQASDSIPWFSAPRNNVEVDDLIVDAVAAAMRGLDDTQTVLDEAVARANELLTR